MNERGSSEFDTRMTTVSSRMKASGPRTTSAKPSFFSVADIGETPYAVDKANPARVLNWFTALVNHLNEGGYSLGYARWAPNAVIPRHRHDCDQIVLVVEGSVSQGNRKMTPGCGYYTPAGAAYGLQVGPEGCSYVEFRHARLDDVGTEMLTNWPDNYQWLTGNDA